MTVEVAGRTKEIVYPDSDGQPMAENTLQFQWIVTIQGGLDALFADRPDVFVAGDLLWYPVEGEPKIRQAPDALVAFGRPKGYCGSYQQWKEGNIPPQVVFEVLSPNNTSTEMLKKLAFYEKYGVEECYYYDPENVELFGWQRQGDRLVVIPVMPGWISPRLTIRFELAGGELQIYRPDGKRFFPTWKWFSNRDRPNAKKNRPNAKKNRPNAKKNRLCNWPSSRRPNWLGCAST